MAKGQKRSGREAKKPKADKKPTAAAAPSAYLKPPSKAPGGKE